MRLMGLDVCGRHENVQRLQVEKKWEKVRILGLEERGCDQTQNEIQKMRKGKIEGI